MNETPIDPSVSSSSPSTDTHDCGVSAQSQQSMPQRAETTHDILLVDEAVRWVRRPRDLYGAVLVLVAIAIVMFLAAYGSATTLAITLDVRSATQGFFEKVLFFPINVLEGLLSFFLPVLVAIDLLWHRQWRKLISSIVAAAAAVGSALLMLWVCVHYFPVAKITKQLSDSLAEQSYVMLIPYVGVISALLTVTSSSRTWKVTSWGWPLLAVALVASVIKGNQTLPGALVTVLLGILCGLIARYVAGDVPERSTGANLIASIRRAGIDAVSVVRIDIQDDDIPLYAWRTHPNSPLGYTNRFSLEQIRGLLGESPENDDEKSPAFGEPNTSDVTTNADTPAAESSPQPELTLPLAESDDELPADPALVVDEDSAPNTSDFTIDPDIDPYHLREQLRNDLHPPLSTNVSRNYIVTDSNGVNYHVGLIDADKQIVDVLSALWKKALLTTATRRSERSIEEAADRQILMELAAADAGLTPHREMRYANGHNSMLVAYTLNGATALADINPADVDDDSLDCLWETLATAHTRGISHGNISGDTITIRDGRVELIHWDRGSLASPELTRRIDLAQAITALASWLGVERAIASARRSLTTDQLVGLAPILQKTIIPASTMAHFADRKDFQRLRDALSESVPMARDISPVELRRFSPKTVITISIGLVAVYLLLASINIEELSATISQAVPGWMVFAFLAGMASFVGAAIVLQAYTAEKLKLVPATLVQLAASVVALVAPAGIGPAALNLRYLQKQKVATPIAVATVSLVQVAQFVTTVLLLLALSLLTGDIGSFAVPSSSVLIAIGVAAVLVIAIFLIKPLRTWVIAKMRPIFEQIWPRLVWLGTHPTRFLYGFLGSLIQTAGYVGAFGGALAAFGYDLPLVTLTVTYLVSNSVGSIVPSPGGIGPVEAALTVGLTAAGVPYSIAFSTALLYRLLTFWIRVPLGWISLRFCQKHDIV
ncbi:flippase-like domain-containing protein [Arcanobacterium haemolyticum]|nr:flippase-like domain-containing protein [Arcanobacterium haemolyticum]